MIVATRSFCPSWRCWVPSRRACIRGFGIISFVFLRLRRNRHHHLSGLRRRLGGRRPRREGRSSAAFKRVERAVQARSAGELTVGAIGLLVGLAGGGAAVLPGAHRCRTSATWLLLPLFMILGYVFAVVGRQEAPRASCGWSASTSVGDGRDDGQPRRRGTLVDTRAIIDGRIADIVAPAFSSGELVVPEFVLKELQQVADSADPLKRNRGRRGLEVVQDLRSGGAGVDARTSTSRSWPEVDAKLLKLAKQRGAADPHDRLQPQPAGADPGRRDPERERAGQRAQAGGAPGRAVRRAADPRGQGDRAGRRLPRRRHHGRGRGRAQADRATASVQVTSVLQSPSGKMIFTRLTEARGP